MYTFSMNINTKSDMKWGTFMCLTWLKLLESIVMHFTSSVLCGFHANFTQTYLGVVLSAEREMSIIDLDIRKWRKDLNFLHFSPVLLGQNQPMDMGISVGQGVKARSMV